MKSEIDSKDRGRTEIDREEEGLVKAEVEGRA
jgi:hypothetical protein